MLVPFLCPAVQRATFSAAQPLNDGCVTQARGDAIASGPVQLANIPARFARILERKEKGSTRNTGTGGKVFGTYVDLVVEWQTLP